MSTKGVLNPDAAGITPPAKFRATRSNTKAITQQTNVSPQMATLEKKQAKAKEAREAGQIARHHLISEKFFDEETPVTNSTLLRTLTQIIQKYNASTPQNLIRTLTNLTVLMHEANASEPQLTPTIEILTQKLGERIDKSLKEEMGKMSNLITSSLAEQRKDVETPESLNEAINTLKQVTSDMNKTINEATMATTQITDTAYSYKQALLQTTTQPAQPQNEATRTRNMYNTDNTGLMLGIDKKARQVLLDTAKGEDNYWNIYEIKEKAEAALGSMTPTPPKGVKIQEAIKLRNGSMILQFATKESADWLRTPANKAAFIKKFDPEATIRERVHPIMVPRIPITFDPNNPAHLRETEEVNRLPTGTIKKARWIKPEYRRAPGQSCAHAIFTITSVSVANILLKDGIYINNARTFPKKLKYEPKQCMKCRKWGHFAASCRAETDTCGTCGGQHRTSECTNVNKKYCVSCKSDEHTSWDRNCPEFHRKCAEYSNFHPENNLIYFPTDEDWTMTTRPYQLPLTDKFPNHYNVGSLPPPNRTARQLPTRPIGKKDKHSNKNNGSSQNVVESFFARIDDVDEDDEAPSEGEIVNPTASHPQHRKT